MRFRKRMICTVAILGLTAAACSGGSDSGNGDGGGGNGGSLPRNQTLYQTGTQWGPPANFNPMREWDCATGSIGLVYESLFHYDPNKGELTPWLAEKGSWTDDRTYEVTLRSGIKWSDGQPMTAKDVAYSFEAGKLDGASFHDIWSWLSKAEATGGNTVRFTFSEPHYPEWDYQLYMRPIIPEHIWSKLSDDDKLNGANEKPVGSGAYRFKSKGQDRVVWQRRDDWWGRTALGMEPQPRYIVDVSTPSNEVALNQLSQGQIDLSNNFLPGAAQLVKAGEFTSYYDKPPYFLSANTAWLVPNSTRKPLDDAAFRRALAASVDIDKIVKSVYSDMVAKADPSGLLPQWNQYVDQGVNSELGFKYDAAAAKSQLEQSGYRDRNGDGYVENKDGSKIDLKIEVPTGWTDWMEAARSIAEDGKAAGIRITPGYPDQNALNSARGQGKFDLILNNEKQLSNSPWVYYDYLFHLPIAKEQNTVNFGRYENKEAWDLVRHLGGTKTDDTAGMKADIAKLQRIQLEEMPAIPLWYNGLWAQSTSGVWQGWPADGSQNTYAPATWRGWYQMGGFEMLTKLKPAK